MERPVLKTYENHQIDEFFVHKMLGSGGSGTVYLAQNGDQIVALKTFVKLSHFDLEVDAYSQVQQSERTPTLFKQVREGALLDGEEGGPAYIILELAARGDLFEYVYRLKFFPEPVARNIFCQLLEAVESVHSSGLAHLDIKLENVFVCSDFTIKLGDLGFAERHSAPIQKRRGTAGYMSPEVIRDEPFDGIRADVFSTGATFFSFAIGVQPFRDGSDKDLFFKRFYSPQPSAFWNIFQRVPGSVNINPSFKDLIHKVFAHDPQDRIGIQEIRGHEWMQGPVASQEELESYLSQANVPLILLPTQEEAMDGFKGSLESSERTSERTFFKKEHLGWRTTRLYKKANPDVLFEDLKDFYRERAIKMKEDDNKFKLTVKLNGMSIVVCLGEEQEQELIIVDVCRIQGSGMDFIEMFDELKEHLTK